MKIQSLLVAVMGTAALVGCNTETAAVASTNDASPDAVAKTPPPPVGKGTLVGHTNFRRCETSPPEYAARVSRLKVFFAHASVGGNIVQGMRKLHEHDPSRYPMVVEGAGERPSGTKAGIFYEFDRGNPGASQKIVGFEATAANGWAKPNADVIVNKFCYIDGDANVDQYLESMQRLEAKHPGTTVVYCTMPIMTGDNAQRDAFNTRVRAWATQKQKALLDIADIEAFSPSGAATEEKGVQALCAEYSADGGHLNDTGAIAVAKGFYTLLQSVAN